MAENDNREVLEQEILEDAGRRADRAQKKAQRDANRIRVEAEEQAEAERERILTRARERASRESGMILAAVPLAGGRHKLELQERLIRRAMAEARERLGQIAPDERMRLLVDLGAAAVGAMAGNAFVVTVHAGGGALDTGRLRNEIMQVVRAGSGRDVVVACETCEEMSPGIVIRSADGRQAWDNTIQARMERLRAALRREITPLLFGEVRTC